MPSKNHIMTIENPGEYVSNEATTMLLNNSNANTTVDEVGNYQGFHGSLDQDNSSRHLRGCKYLFLFYVTGHLRQLQECSKYPL